MRRAPKVGIWLGARHAERQSFPIGYRASSSSYTCIKAVILSMRGEETAVHRNAAGLAQPEQTELWGLPLCCTPISCHFSCSLGRPY